MLLLKALGYLLELQVLCHHISGVRSAKDMLQWQSARDGLLLKPEDVHIDVSHFCQSFTLYDALAALT